jgi:putative flippase GtrA
MTVGAIGFVLQLGVLALMTTAVGWPYAPATAVAVQIAVLHNFLWHERWTWRDRTGDATGGVAADGRGPLLERLVRYEVTTGVTSILGNLLGTAILVERFGMFPIAANVIAVMMLSVANFLISDRWVFARRAAGIGAAVMMASASPASAQPGEEALAAWNAYIASVDTQFNQRRLSAPAPGEPQGNEIDIAGGRIHHWRGSILLRGITVDALLKALMTPGTPPPQEDVLESRVLSRSADSLRLYLKLIRRTVMTVTYDTEHLVTFRREAPGVASCRSVSTEIRETDGRDRGFLWRLNAYWRYIQVGDDVRVELQSISLSRDVPTVIKPVASRVITRIARESVTKALDALRYYART